MGMLFDDFVASAGYEPGKPVISQKVEEGLAKGLVERLSSVNVIIGKPDIPALQKELKNIKGTTPYAEESRSGINDLIKAVKENTPMTIPVPTEDGDLAACIVAAPEPGTMKKLMTYNSPEGYPGSDADWDSYIMFHEKGHCDDFTGDTPSESEMEGEIKADTQAMRDYYKAYRDGVVKDAEVPYAFRAMRADLTMHDGVTRSSDQYAVNTILPLPGEDASALKGYKNNDSVAADIFRARETVFQLIAKEISDQETGNIQYGVKNPEDRDYLEAVVEQQPDILYEASRVALFKGKLDDNPAGKKFVEIFLDGAERYNHKKYRVFDEERPTGRPAIVEELAAKFAPVREPSLDKSFSFKNGN